MKSKKRMRWGNFFIYLIVSFPLFLVVIWFASITMPFDIPVMMTTAVISALTSLCCAYQTDEEYQAEQEAAKYVNTQPKEKSVVGSAVIGSIIAGPVGGVVGAIHAADKNAKNRAKS